MQNLRFRGHKNRQIQVQNNSPAFCCNRQKKINCAYFYNSCNENVAVTVMRQGVPHYVFPISVRLLQHQPSCESELSKKLTFLRRSAGTISSFRWLQNSHVIYSQDRECSILLWWHHAILFERGNKRGVLLTKRFTLYFKIYYLSNISL